jgi:serine/threonine-protein kinase
MNTPGPRLPERIGRYRVTARIGKGAMGAVYSCLDEQLGRQVAVKLMLAEFEEDPELRERFFREARITGQLAHRNIVTVFDMGEEGGRPYIVM